MLGVADGAVPEPASDGGTKGLAGVYFPLGKSDERASKARRRAAGVTEGVAEEVEAPNSKFGP